MLQCPALILAALLVTAASASAQRGSVVFPIGTELPVRFLQRIESGRDSVGSDVVVQTMAALELDGCVATPAYTSLAGHVVESRGGRPFGRRGFLDIVFDSVRVRGDEWLRFPAVLDTLEYAHHRELHASGTFHGAHGSLLSRLSTAGAIGAVAATGVGAIPAAVLGVYWAARHGPRAKILAGETARVRLLKPLVLAADRCESAAAIVAPPVVPVLPAFPPQSTDRAGTALGDPINLVMLGTRGQLDSAFLAAGWLRSQSPHTMHQLEAVFTVIAKLHASHPPVSTQYFEGRAQDVTYELAGPNARMRHHVRFWQLDSLPNVWVGAATRDAGLLVKKRTHRIDPLIDDERDLVVRNLEGGGAASLLEYTVLPDSRKRGRLMHGQRFVSDGRTAVVTLKSAVSGVAETRR